MKYFAVTVFGIIFAFLLADFMFAQPVSQSAANGGARTAPALNADGTAGAADETNGAANGSADAAEVFSDEMPVAFKHVLHGDSIGLDCAHCHTGAKTAGHAYMPSKSDCIDCHRLPLTEKPGIETLDSALALAPSQPWVKKSMLPEHVVFHHGVHTVAGVTCDDCHGSYKDDSYGGEKFDMRTCLACHRGEIVLHKKFKPAATYCAACHR